MLSIRRTLLIRLLKFTDSGQADLSEVKQGLKVTTETFHSFINELSNDGVLTLNNGNVTLDLNQRLELARLAIREGADLESISRCLTWLEFEELSAQVFEENGFRVLRRFRFQADGRRWEIDLLSMRFPYIICGECKHWGRGIGNQTARSIIETHLEKTEVYSRHLLKLKEKIGIANWATAIAIPVVLNLSATPMEIYRRVPSVSVQVLPRFLEEFDGQLDRLTSFRVELPPRELKVKQTRFRGKAR